ncbi:MAG TPA: hypothetical protein VE046_01475 [Steroidobacteraceae bacterium]|nr:hypothetical protein [Steroidobacteraceae bacterium]
MAGLQKFLGSRAICVVPWLAMLVLVVIAACVNAVIDLDQLPLDTSHLFPADIVAAVSADLPSVTRHLTARITWGLTSIGFGLVALAAIGTAMYVLGSCLRELAHAERAACGWAIFGCALPFALIAGFGGNLILSEPAATEALRAATLHQTIAHHAVSADSLFDKLSYLIFLLLAAAASATLLWPTADQKSPALLRRRIARVQSLLFIGATGLALRALEMYFLYRWPAAWLTGAPAESVDQIALAVSTAYGAFYTGILASLYLPTAFLLRLRASRLADESVPDDTEKRDAWLAKSGLEFLPFREFGHLLVILAPLLAGGPLAKVIGAIGG